MPCYSPIQGWRSRTLSSNGKRPVVFQLNQGYSDLPVELPCGQCIGCRLERSRQWAIRCLHEAKQYENNCFITLTYDNEHLPWDGSLDIEHFQKFMKRLRKKYEPRKIRFYHCGEYGEQNDRPHYHACLFNFDFLDKKLYKKENDIEYYTSESLQELWPFGFNIIGDVTFESAAYVARYIMKKVNGVKADNHYYRMLVHPITGEILAEWQNKPEYTTMSRGQKTGAGGIGKGWYDKWKTDVYPSDQMVIRGQIMRPPKFYDTQYELTNPKAFRLMKAQRMRNAKKHASDNTPKRLKVREQVAKARLKKLPRNLQEHEE